MIAFIAGALFWARDTWQEFRALPALMRQQAEGLGQLEAAIMRLEGELGRRLAADRSPALGFPGTGHTVDDAAPGAWTLVRWRPVRPLRADCVPAGIDAWMVDADGTWFAVETALTPMPALEGETDLAFGVRVHPGMDRGRAQVLVQVSFDCGSHRQVETAPWLQFRVLD
jgi:hypothetical protein